ncbi:MAG: glycosyltransferase [Lachnospiraceae bacterium]|nr:glycosyltransferase [Lachnospiraceae bacterium]
MSTTDRPVRVLNVLGGTDLGGAESRIMDLLRHMDRDSVVFDFLVHMDPVEYRKAVSSGVSPESLRKEQHFDREIRDLGGRIFAVPRPEPGDYSFYSKAVKRFFEEHKGEFSVLEGHMTSTAPVYMKIAAEYGIHPIVCHVRSAGTGKGFKGFLRKLLRRNAGKRADILFSCSEKAAKAVFGNRKSYFVPNAVETGKFVFDSKNRADVRSEYGLSGCRVIGHIGRFSYPKNHTFLLKVFADIAASQKDVRLLLVGDGELFPEVRKEAESLGIGDLVVFTGSRSDPERFYSAMDVLVFPSRYEGMPGTVIEAQANGLPCLISDTISGDTAVCETVKTLSLGADVSSWGKQALSMMDGEEGHRETVSAGNTEKLKEALYDVEALSERLKVFYTGGGIDLPLTGG